VTGAGVLGGTGAGVLGVTGAIVVTGAGGTPCRHCLYHGLLGIVASQINPGSQQPIVYIVKVKEEHKIRIDFETSTTPRKQRVKKKANKK
jgi:hypothetical protein